VDTRTTLTFPVECDARFDVDTPPADDRADRRRLMLRGLVATAFAVVAAAVAAAVMVTHDPGVKRAGLPGELVYQRGTVAWRLQTAECKYDALVDALIEDGKVTAHKAAVIQQGEREWTACWAQDADTDVLLVDITGARGYMPRDWFKEVAKN
jgi:hypothetical protein